MEYWQEILDSINKNNLNVDVEKIKLSYSLLKTLFSPCPSK